MNAISTPPREDPNFMAWPRPNHLAVGRGHRMAWRDLGNPLGEPWLVLHGGPGSGAQPGLVAPLDRRWQRAIVPDQRGSGASQPRGATRGNHTAALVADLEALRERLGLPSWAVLAGSWGTVLALAYARQHPQRVQRLVLRGAFALSEREVAGLLLPGRARLKNLGEDPLWPARHRTPLPVVLRRLTQLLQSGTPGVAALRVARRWGVLEAALAEQGLWRSLHHAQRSGAVALAQAIHESWAALRRRLQRAQAQARRPQHLPADRAALAKFRVQAHYLRHRGFLRPGELDRAVLAVAEAGVPVDWVHGRCDAVCPPANSRRWAARWGRLSEPLSGHLGQEPDMLSTLRNVVAGEAC